MLLLHVEDAVTVEAENPFKQRRLTPIYTLQCINIITKLTRSKLHE